MPKVIGYTPPFLKRPAPGSKIFTTADPQSPSSPGKRGPRVESSSETQYQGPRRLIASRGTEIFTVVGNKIRWADIATVRDQWEDDTQSGSTRSGVSRASSNRTGEDGAYRVLSIPTYYQIRQISVSPSGFFLAVSTEHTVHIAVLPDSSRLKEADRSPVKVKTYQLGPTVHVIPESPLAAVLWHPLAYATSGTDCLVTVTAEAAVRLWEFDKASAWSVNRPELAIDLKKLVDGTSCEEDFEPEGLGKNRGFSVDDFDMEVSSACFGGRARDDEDAWASMTVWTAMRNGDIYALCPLLPSKWQPTATTIPALTTAAVARMATVNDDNADVVERRVVDQQYEWVQEIDTDEPEFHRSTNSLDELETRKRPQNPSVIPRLQGPFTLGDDADEIEVSDIYIFPAGLDEQDLFDGDDDDELHSFDAAVPFTTICIATPENEVQIFADFEGVSGQWLPKKASGAFSVPYSDATPLTMIEALALGQPTATTSSWPVFTPDTVNANCLFLATQTRIYSLSLNEWNTTVGSELVGTEAIDPGLRKRLRTRCRDHDVAVTDKLIEISETKESLSAAAIIDHESVGYLLLTCTADGPYAVTFDRDYFGASTLAPSSDEFAMSTGHHNSQLVRLTEEADHVPTREPFAPPRCFYQNQEAIIDTFRRKLPPQLRKSVTEQPMRLSPAILHTMTNMHRSIGQQSAHLENGAAELFRRCERLQTELADQMKAMTDLALQLQRLANLNQDDGDGSEPKKSPTTRITDAQERQKNLVTRYEALRRKVGKVGSAKRELSAKELAWIEEIDTLGKNLGAVEDEQADETNGSSTTSLDQRFEKVKQLTQTLIDDHHRLEKQMQPQNPSSPQQPQKQPPNLEASISSISNSSITPSMSASQITLPSHTRSSTTASPRSSTLWTGLSVSSRLQKERIADVMGLVEREGAVIEAAMARLERLKGIYQTLGR